MSPGSPDQLDIDNRIFEVYRDEILEKAKEHNLKKVTKMDIELYFMINRIPISRRLYPLLYRSVNLELKKRK